MLKLDGKHSYLRALEPSDLDFLYQLENNTDNWELSGTQTPYSKAVLKFYLENSHRDIYEVKQLRLCICNKSHVQIGLIDLFDFDPKNKRAGLGIIINNEKDRNVGFGTEAIAICCDYAFSTLGLHQIYANILEDNGHSTKVFEKLGFLKVGVKKDWILTGSQFKNEVLYQKFKP
ncbi:GNAT family N-acetyltransferase [Croceitalea rosinachiae]|uniref:GNAT family N-acetyltransferase n=1 Tax=Croceitalea rosinachiae TaxID=3075596 RepID=A0ABU3ABG0_9FLAO|nr:GNAT family N-acetyltransferase [Croceitalea sp. F388]MDT0607248.1 GNAT family N-acetyltransferase [Croceitalea sp. F388]